MNKVESKNGEFVKTKVGNVVLTGTVAVFVLISFFTVFREGVGSDFLSISDQFRQWNEFVYFKRIDSGMVTVLSIAFYIKRKIKKLPLRLIFGTTMAIGAFISITFMGNALRSFQEIGLIPITPLLDDLPILDGSIVSTTGIHPTLESRVGQIVLFLIYLIVLTHMLAIRLKEKKKKINNSNLNSR